MTVEKAIEAWPMLMDAGLCLGSPVVHPDNDWMKKFMQQAADHRYRIDFVAVHWYGDPNPQQLIKVLDDAYRLYRLPLWITEFAVADWQNGAGKPPRFTTDQVVQFMQAVLLLLNARRSSNDTLGSRPVPTTTTSACRPSAQRTARSRRWGNFMRRYDHVSIVSCTARSVTNLLGGEQIIALLGGRKSWPLPPTRF